jgi:hypothetical protein
MGPVYHDMMVPSHHHTDQQELLKETGKLAGKATAHIDIVGSFRHFQILF